MLPLERQNRILELLAERQALSVDELCRLLYSSGATIRRDLSALEAGGMLRRTHGGAVLIDRNARDFPLTLRESENPAPKTRIAEQALTLIRDGQTLFLDASSTVHRLAQKLADGGFSRLRVITNGLKTADTLSKTDGIAVYCTGGRLLENDKSFVGDGAQRFIADYHADIAFVSCRGVTPEAGVTESNEEEAGVKRLFLRHARQAVLLADGSKLGERYFCRLCAIDDIHRIISDVELPPGW